MNEVRHRHDLSADGAGRARGRRGESRHRAAAARRRGARPARLHHRPSSIGGRHAVRRRPGHGDEGRAAGEGGGVRAQHPRAQGPWCCCRRRDARSRRPRRCGCAASEHVVLVCGRYEGMDDRVAALVDAEELSIGDYVLSGGEVRGARRARRGQPAGAGRRRRRRVGGAGVVRRRRARLSALYAAARVSRPEGAGRARLGPPRRGAAVAEDARRSIGRCSGGPICSSTRRWTRRAARCWTNCVARVSSRSVRS